MNDERADAREAAPQEYERPMIIRIKLEADEVLSNGCKGTLGSAQGSVPCSGNGCFDSGS